MTSAIHSKQVSADGIHTPISFLYADATERGAATGFISTDLNKFALQASNNTLWILTSFSPPEWTSVGSGGGGGGSLPNGGTTGQGLVKENNDDGYAEWVDVLLDSDFSGSYDGALTRESPGVFSIKKHNLTAITDPTPSNDSTEDYSVGSFWIDTSTDSAYVCLTADVGNAKWRKISQISSSTGLLVGGELTINADPSKFDLEAGAGYIVDSVTDPLNPNQYIIVWGDQTAITTTNLATANYTAIAIDGYSQVEQLGGSRHTAAERRQKIILGRLGHPNNTSITNIISTPIPAVQLAHSATDLALAQGPFNVDGNIYTANGANLQLNVSSGRLFGFGVNFHNDPENPNVIELSAEAPISFTYYRQNGTGGWIQSIGATILDPGNYDDGTGTLNNVSNTRYSIQPVYRTFSSENIIYYAQTHYNNLNNAKAGIYDPVLTDPSMSEAVLRGWIIMKGNASDLTDASQTAILTAVDNPGSGTGITSHSLLDDLLNDDHPQYYDESRLAPLLDGYAATTDARFLPPGGDDGYVLAKASASDYDVAWSPAGAAGIHSSLSGLNGDDHPQYYNDSRLDGYLSTFVPIYPGTIINQPTTAVDAEDSVLISDLSDSSFLKQTTITGLHDSIRISDKNNYFFDDLLGRDSNQLHQWVVQNAGTGTGSTSLSGVAGHPGIIRTSTGVQTTGRASFYTDGAGGIAFGGSTEMQWLSLGRISAIPTVTEEYVLIAGLNDTQGAGTYQEGCHFRIDRAISDGYWVAQTVSDFSATNTITSVPIVPSQWYRFRIIINSAGDSVRFYIDGTLVATHSTNIPDSGEPVNISHRILKSAGGTAVTYDVDYIAFQALRL